MTEQIREAGDAGANTNTVEGVAALAQRVISEVERAVVGKRSALEMTMAAFLTSGGHVLLEDYPGLAKTLMANSFATALGMSFKRIQFTPDLLPGDITGGYIFDRAIGEFVLRKGPIFAHIILADEINRASPRTQSALLEAMQEYQVTLEGETMTLLEPFIVMATQNPIEYEGTFPLPEAQLDRFLMRVSLGYPTPEEQMRILDAQQYAHPIESLRQIANAGDLVQVQDLLKGVYADALIKQYIVQIVEATRRHADVYLGASPRGALTLFRTSQARAALHGRDYVIPDDVKALAEPALGHRIILSPAARIKGITTSDILSELLQSMPVPGAKVK